MVRLIYVLLLCIACTSSLSGCVAAVGYAIYKNNQIKNQEVDAAMQSANVDQSNRARVRFIGQATVDMGFYRNQQCYGNKNKTMVSRDGIGGLFTSKKSFSIGMPQTENTKKLSDRDGLLPISVAKAFYREYAFAADEPVTISTSYSESTGQMNYSCPLVNAYFVPEKNKDYEVTLDVKLDQKLCFYKISQIVSEANEVKVIRVSDAQTAPKCNP